jgi:arylsulfatase A-like enzyme
VLTLAAGSACDPTTLPSTVLPNVILCMSDDQDQGWGDTGYNGHDRLRTPHLDALARGGVRFDRFYASPMCSPTRAGVLTGRNPARHGIFTSGLVSLPTDETTIAEVLASRGYAAGHFGKWHLGTLSRTVPGRRTWGARREQNFSPPWEHGFEVSFSTETSVPTWDPLVDPDTGGKFGASYWEGPDRPVEQDLSGDDSRLIMDRATAFIRAAVSQGRPFLAVVWFHAPHRPARAGPEWARVYGDAAENERDHWGSLSAMDAQMGRLGRTLEELGVRDDTIVFFCSDNGPSLNVRKFVSAGSAAPFRGGKGELLEGGVRVPGIFAWPAAIPESRVVGAPVSVLDLFPTVLAGIGPESSRVLAPLDGVDLLPLIQGTPTERPTPIAFRTREEAALVDERYKLLSEDRRTTWRLYDLIDDPGESSDVAAERPEVLRAMLATLDEWQLSCGLSRQGGDHQRGDPPPR